MIKKKAFTLAEALTTLTILGVVAALTLPQIIGNFNDHANITAQKAFINDMRNAIQMIAVEDGKLNKIKDEGTYLNINEAFIKEKLGSVLKISKICMPYDSPGTSASQRYRQCGWINNYSGNPYKVFDAVGDSDKIALAELTNGDFPFDTSENDKYSPEELLYLKPLRLANGTSIYVSYNQNCAKLTAGEAIAPKHVCLNMIYDINGKDEPNQVGRDVGFITVFSSKKPIVAAPILYEGSDTENASGSYNDAANYCKELAKAGKADIPTEEEAVALFFNQKYITGKTSWKTNKMFHKKARSASNGPFLCVHRN